MRYVIWPIVVLAIAGSGFIGWYLAHAQAVQAEQARDDADRYVNWAQRLAPVNVRFVVKAPDGTPDGQNLYLAGSAPTLGAWADAGYKPLTRQADGTWVADVELMTGLTHEFKVTRGNWATVEVDEKGQERGNHTFTIEPDKDSGEVQVSIARWRDDGKSDPFAVTLTGLIDVLPKIRSEELANEREVIVYLPPGYNDPANANTRYPVLYMHDGQNLMNTKTSFKGIEWQVDETAERLISEGKIAPVIIVGVYNAEQRTPEFTPGVLASGEEVGGARGEVYGKFVVEKIKPLIDSKYRTLPDKANTSLAGSSMGGLITLAMLKQFPDTFGNAAVLTPHLQINGKPATLALGDDLSFLKGRKFYIDMGDQGGDNYPGGADPMKDAEAFVAKLSSSGLKADQDFKYVPLPGTSHDEPAWQKRFDQVLVYLYGK
jgi:predicted alpha/beta superfamily hydrolase